MLGDVNGETAVSLMRTIETQSKITLLKWSVEYAKDRYLPLLESDFKIMSLIEDTLKKTVDYIDEKVTLNEVKNSIRELRKSISSIKEPVSQAAAKAIVTACGVITAPANSLGFIFYGAAAYAYSRTGIKESVEIYDALAEEEMKNALESLRAASVKDEENPVKINWNC